MLLHADIVGSTALVDIDATLAHQRFQETFHRFSDTIATHNGITHEVRGDALVAELERASDAVTAALRFQQDQAVRFGRMSSAHGHARRA